MVLLTLPLYLIGMDASSSVRPFTYPLTLFRDGSLTCQSRVWGTTPPSQLDGLPRQHADRRSVSQA